MRSLRKNPGGFTLVELLFSMTIGSIVLLLAASMLGTSGESYERVGANVATEREARALITQLSSDLSTAFYREETLIVNDTAAWPKDQLGFLCLKPEEAQDPGKAIGDVCAVIYYVSDVQIGGTTTRCLMRGFRESTATFAALKAGQLKPLLAVDPLNPPATDEPIAFGVVSFTALPKDRAGNPYDQAADPKIGPATLDFRMVLARRNLMGRLKTTADWDNSPKLIGNPSDAEKNQNLEIYQTSLRFGNHAKL